MATEDVTTDAKVETPHDEQFFEFEGFQKPEVHLSETLSFERSGDQQHEWEKVKEIVKRNLLTDDGTILGELSKYGQSIDAKWENNSSRSEFKFPFFHVEALLDQSADLLDRAVRDRLEWDELSAKYAELILELAEFVELDEIHKEEEQNGLYEVEWWSSRADKVSSNILKQKMGWLKRHHQRTKEWLYSNQMFNKVTNAARKAGWLSALVPYKWSGQSFKGYVSHTYGGVKKKAFDHAADSAYDQSLHSHREKLASMTSSQIEAEASELVAKERENSASILTTWNDKNRDFQRRRTLASRKIQDMKAKSATNAEGALNYAKRLDGIQERFKHDLSSAVIRIEAAREGLEKVYGIESELPDTSSNDIFDQYLIWTRAHVEQIVRFSRLDQAVVIPISIAKLIDGNFNEQIADGVIEFDVPLAVFPNSRHVRLRGVSATIDTGPEKTSWTLQFKVPAIATIRRLDDSLIEIDQSSLPSVTLGRVWDENNRREPEIGGVTALMNSSPFGKWELQLISSVRDMDFSKVRNCTLNLHVAYRGIQ